jgi:EpsI family protein
VRSLLIGNGRQRLQLWYWYDIGGALTSGPRTAKIRQAWNLITGNRQGDALVVLATPVDNLDTRIDADVLRAFVTDHLDRLKQCLRPGIDKHPFCASESVQNRISEQ